MLPLELLADGARAGGRGIAFVIRELHALALADLNQDFESLSASIAANLQNSGRHVPGAPQLLYKAIEGDIKYGFCVHGEEYFFISHDIDQDGSPMANFVSAPVPASFWMPSRPGMLVRQGHERTFGNNQYDWSCQVGQHNSLHVTAGIDSFVARDDTGRMAELPRFRMTMVQEGAPTGFFGRPYDAAQAGRIVERMENALGINTRVSPPYKQAGLRAD